MHMADALVVPAVAATMYLCSAATAGVSVHNVKIEDENNKKVPLMGVMGAFVFAAQMVNFTIPGTGSSGHLCGAMLLSAILGPSAGFLTMTGVLLIQCLLFADGGLLALGCNIWNMAFYGCFIGVGVIWKLMMKKGVTKGRIFAASMAGSILALQLGAFSVVLETMISGITELPFGAFVLTMQPIHLAIGAVEGLITSAVLIFIYEARPELLWGVRAEDEHNGRLSAKSTLIILAAATIVIGAGLSLLASSNPDGLEWSMEQVAGTSEIEATGNIFDKAAGLINATALLPDYAFKGSDSGLGTSFSGVVGLVIVFALCAGVCFVINLVKKRGVKEVNE